MAYVVQPGREVHDGTIYVAGDVYPAMKGAIPALVADGVVLWVTVEKPKLEAKATAGVEKAPAKPRKPASQQRAKGKKP